MTTLSATTNVGVFPTRVKAEQAVADLKAAGYRDDQIGLVGQSAIGRTAIRKAGHHDNASEGLAVGAAAGAAAGAAVGAGILAGLIPVIGPVLAIGTLGTILLNATGGAAVAGLAGALIGWGVPEEDAVFFENEVASGRFVVTVDDADGDDLADAIFRRNGGSMRTPAMTPTDVMPMLV